MLKHKIQIVRSSNDELWFDYAQEQYYTNTAYKIQEKRYPGPWYYILLPVVIAFSHTVDYSIPELLASETFIRLLVILSVLTGIILGEIITALRTHSASIDQTVSLQLVRGGDIIENYSLISGALRLAQSQCWMYAVIYILPVLSVLFVIISRSGILVSVIIVISIAICVLVTETSHPFKKIQYLYSRIHYLNGQCVDMWLGKFLYWIYGKRNGS